MGANMVMKSPMMLGLPKMEYTRVRTEVSVCVIQLEGMGTATIYWYTPCSAITVASTTSAKYTRIKSLSSCTRRVTRKNQSMYCTVARKPEIWME